MPPDLRGVKVYLVLRMRYLDAMSVELPPIEELERELAVRAARDQRDRALLSVRTRRRATRSRIVLGGAVLAEIRDTGDPDFVARIIAILHERVPRDRDRDDLSDLIGLLLPKRGHENDDPANAALPDFDAMENEAMEALPSIADLDPEFMDVKDFIADPDKS